MRTRTQSFQTLALTALLASGLGACAQIKPLTAADLAVPPDSPVAAAVLAAASNPGPWPTFSKIAKAPTGQTAKAEAPKALTLTDQAVMAQADRLRAQAAATPPAGTAAVEAFAAQQRAAVSAVPVPAESATSDIEAIARAARARATPPPPPS